MHCSNTPASAFSYPNTAPASFPRASASTAPSPSSASAATNIVFRRNTYYENLLL